MLGWRVFILPAGVSGDVPESALLGEIGVYCCDAAVAGKETVRVGVGANLAGDEAASLSCTVSPAFKSCLGLQGGFQMLAVGGEDEDEQEEDWWRAKASLLFESAERDQSGQSLDYI